MNKKVIGIIVAIIIICVIGILVFCLLTNKFSENKNENNNNNEIVDNENEENESLENGKVLVVYYSATNNTKNVAEKIAKNLNGDIFEIAPIDIYTSNDLDWTNSNSRVSKEHDDASLRNVELVSTTVDNWDSYDKVLIGYPIWWGIAAWPVDTFVKANDFSGKTVIPFCTSSSSGLGQSGILLRELAGTGNWLDGHRFTSSPSNTNIKNWTDSLI